MARTFSISDGTTTISLINSSGFYLADDKSRTLKALTPSRRTIWNSSMFSDGRSPVLSSANNVTERFSLILKGTSHDNVSSQLQSLIRLLRKAEKYHTKAWQQTPVYIISQTTNETNTRYALVYSGRLDGNKSPFDYTYEKDDYMLDLTLELEREPYWRSHAPHTLPTAINLTAASAPGTGIEQVIANYRGNVSIDKIYNYDTNLAAFSSDFSASSSFTYFEVSGSTPASGDMVYFGATSPFFTVVLNVGTAAVTSGVTTAYEYWDGAAWAATDNISDVFCESDFETGVIVLVHNSILADDWAKNTINGSELYWLRIRITAVTSWTTSPTQADQVVYISDDDYISLANTQIDGDVPAKLLIKAKRFTGTDIGNLVLGTKSRGLTSFTSRLNAGDDSINPGDWTISYGDDTATESNPLGPDGYMAKCDFTTDQTMDARVTWTNTVASEIKDWEGQYHVYARLMQENGAVGDISLQLGIELGQDQYTGETVYFENIELFSAPFAISLGTYTVLSPQLRGSDTAATDLVFELSAKSDNGATPDLFVLDLVFIPIDEWATVIGTTSALDISSNQTVNIDNGILRSGATIIGNVSSDVVGAMEYRGTPPFAEASREIRLYIFAYSIASAPYSMCGQQVAISIYPHEQWEFLRGAD